MDTLPDSQIQNWDLGMLTNPVEMRRVCVSLSVVQNIVEEGGGDENREVVFW